MSGSDLVEILQRAQPFVYGVVAICAVIQWRRRPTLAGAWLTASLGVLATVIVASQILPENSRDPVAVGLQKAVIAVLVLFPYCLFRFMGSFVRPARWLDITAAFLTVAVAIGAVLLPPMSEENGQRSGWFQAFIGLFLFQWVLLSGIVAVRLWRAGRGQPTVARRRMRTMSLGSAGLALALIVAAEFSTAGPVTAILVNTLAILAAPMIFIGFAPPYVLRAAWRRREEDAFKQAELSLVQTETALEVARALLPRARATLGAAAVALVDADGNVIASDGQLEDSWGFVDSDPGMSAISIPMQSGQLKAITNPYTPFFGSEEIARLEGFAALADLALIRNKLLDNQRRLAAIVESSDDAIIAKSLDGVITQWNRGAEQIYGYPAAEAIGQPVFMLVPPGDEDNISSILERVSRGESIENYQTKRLTKDRRIIDVSLTVSPIRDTSGQITGVSTIARNVTRQKELEREREAALEEADRANLAKNDFLSRMSHELRTPLNAVLGFAQLLDMEQINDEQKDWTREILKAGQHLLELINEVLDISRIESGNLRLSLEPVDPVLAAQECVSLLAPLATQEGISLELDDNGLSSSTYVLADRQRLKQVLLNIISNGIKYNRAAGAVRISFEPLLDGERLRINVTDTGLGIPTARIEQLFSPFERLGADTSGVEGTGLGLALSKGLVEAMDGIIGVTTEPGGGSTFSVELATVEAPAAGHRVERHADEERKHPAVAKTILYIEDNLSNLKLVERILEQRTAIAVMSAMQGGIAITLARDHRPDLILLDLDLPDMRGEEVLGRLRADPMTANIPVVVISADVTTGQVKRLLEEGASDYLTKPIEVKHFLEIIDKHLSDS